MLDDSPGLPPQAPAVPAQVVDEDAADEAAAEDARALYRRDGLKHVPTDPEIAGSLRAGEAVVASRRSASIELHEGAGETVQPRTDGPLYVTTARIVQPGSGLDVELVNVAELSISGDRLLVALNDGRGVLINLRQPRLFRVQVGAALRGLR